MGNRRVSAPIISSVSPVSNIQRLIGLLGGDEGPRAAANLVAMGAEAIQPLMGCLASPRAEVRSSAAWALGQLGAKSAQKQLQELLEDPDAGVRMFAQGALNRLRNPVAARPVRKTTYERTAPIRRRDAKDLELISPTRKPDPKKAKEPPEPLPAEMQELLESEDSLARGEAIRCLYEHSPDHPAVKEAVLDLAQSLGAEDAKSRSWAAVTLGMVGEAALPALAEAISAPNSATRMYAAWALGMTLQPKAVLPLLDSIADPMIQVRAASAVALGELGDSRSVGSLLAALHDRHWLVREAAARALGAAGDYRALPSLKALFSDVDERVRRAAMESAQRLQEAELDHEYSRLQRSA